MEKPKNSERNLSQCHFVLHKSTWIDPGANPGLRVERQETNDLSHGAPALRLHERIRKMYVTA
jgi:hypothetical protein